MIELLGHDQLLLCYRYQHPATEPNHEVSLSAPIQTAIGTDILLRTAIGLVEGKRANFLPVLAREEVLEEQLPIQDKVASNNHIPLQTTLLQKMQDQKHKSLHL